MVSEDELETLKGLPSFRRALMMWASKRSAVGFNTWQQVVSQVRPFFQDDEDVPPKGDKDYTAKVSSLWKEIMRDVHGPDWRGTIKPLGSAMSGAPRPDPEQREADEVNPGGPESRAFRPALGNPGEGSASQFEDQAAPL